MADETAPANGASVWPIVLKLRKMVIANGEETKELRFREPTPADVERCGDPVNIDFMSGDTPKINYDPKAMSMMMAILAGVPPSTIKQMHIKDWESAKLMLTGPFMPDL
jgi:hypothetical protein